MIKYRADIDDLRAFSILSVSVDLWPVIAIILLSSTPDSAADAANPDLKLWREYFLLSFPAKFKYSLISKATVWSVNLFFNKVIELKYHEPN